MKSVMVKNTNIPLVFYLLSCFSVNSMNCTKSTGPPVLGKASNKQSTFYLENIQKDIFFTVFDRRGVSGVVLKRPPTALWSLQIVCCLYFITYEIGFIQKSISVNWVLLLSVVIRYAMCHLCWAVDLSVSESEISLILGN